MSDTPETDKIAHSGLPERAYISEMTYKARKLERERDEARKEVDRLKEEAELYAGWSKWKDGIWRISHPDSGPSAEWIAEDIDGLKSDKARLDWLNETKCHIVWSDRAHGFYVQRNGQVCGNISGSHINSRDAIDAAMKGDE